MSLEEYVKELHSPHTLHCGFNVGAQWMDAGGYWLITIDEPWRDDAGDFHVGPVWQHHYGEKEASDAYQAVMLGLSDYRASR